MASAQAIDFITWTRLTHGGRRTPESPTCSGCGDVMTELEKAEYKKGKFRPLAEHPPVDPSEARRLYAEATGQTNS